VRNRSRTTTGTGDGYRKAVTTRRQRHEASAECPTARRRDAEPIRDAGYGSTFSMILPMCRLLSIAGALSLRLRGGRWRE
jgi:hypothetical protein